MSLIAGEGKLTWEERFWRRVVKSDDCWQWTGGRGGRGGTRYGVYMLPGQKRRGAHTIAYELANGPLAEGLVIDHLCRRPLCVNPAHLEAVTPQENRRRQRLAITHCKHGHELAGTNLYVDSRGHRSCMECRRRLAREHYWRRRAAA